MPLETLLRSLFWGNSSEQSYLLVSCTPLPSCPGGLPWCHSIGPLWNCSVLMSMQPIIFGELISKGSPLTNRRWEWWLNVSPGQFRDGFCRAPRRLEPQLPSTGAISVTHSFVGLPSLPVSLLLHFTPACWDHFPNTCMEAFVSCSTLAGGGVQAKIASLKTYIKFKVEGC